jgi:hypothetical protein
VTSLLLKRASASRSSGEWSESDYDVLADGVVIGRIMRAAAALEGMPWIWTLIFGYHEDRSPTHGLWGHARGRDGGVREELAVQVDGRPASSLARSGAIKLRCPCAANKR